MFGVCILSLPMLLLQELFVCGGWQQEECDDKELLKSFRFEGIPEAFFVSANPTNYPKEVLWRPSAM
jgi:hypothetical protein